MSGEKKPDPYTNSWWRRVHAGHSHMLHLLSAEVDEWKDELGKVKEKMLAHEQSLEDIRAEIGKLKETIDLARKAYQDLKEKKNG